MSFLLVRLASARSLRWIPLAFAVLAIALSNGAVASAQQPAKQTQSGLSNVQRLDVMRSKLEAMRRSLDSAIAGLNAKDTGD